MSLITGNTIVRSGLFDLDRFFDGALSQSYRAPAQAAVFAPRVDVKETSKAFEISAELPGLDKEDIRITFEDGVLTLQAETPKQEPAEGGGRVIRQERRYGKFARSFELGEQVRESDISASFSKGVLVLTATKHEPEVESPRLIDIT